MKALWQVQNPQHIGSGLIMISRNCTLSSQKSWQLC